MEASVTKKEIIVTMTFTEREAKILACLIGALSPSDAEEIIKRGGFFSTWIGKLENREIIDFTGNVYDLLYDLF